MFRLEFQCKWFLHNLFIDEQVGTLIFLTPTYSTSKCLTLDILWIELAHSLVIELQPLALGSLNITVVVTEFSRTDMHYNSSQFIVVFLLRLCLSLLLIDGVVVEVELQRELPSSVNLLIFHFVVVEADSLEVQDEVVRELADETPLGCVCLLLAVIALVVRYHFSRYELLEAVVDVLLAFDFQRQTEEILIPLNNVFTGATNKLVTVLTAVNALSNVLERCHF